MNDIKQNKSFEILIYGTEKLYFPLIDNLKIGNGINLNFEPIDTFKKFQEYDGVIIFQNIWDHDKEKELKKRIKQITNCILEKSAFICFLVDKIEEEKPDIAINILKMCGCRYFSTDEIYMLKFYRDELKAFFNDFGIAKVKYKYSGDLDYKVIAGTFSDEALGICFQNKIFFLPCHISDLKKRTIGELFIKLCNGLVSLFKKYQQELPEWVNKYKFVKEKELIDNKNKIKEEFNNINKSIDIFNNYKKILAYSDELLKESVADLLEKGFGFNIDRKDLFIEDLKIYNLSKDENKKIKALIEVKGVNKNVCNEHINQLDTHRERNNLKNNFPAILIVNTFIKSSNSLNDKDKPINNEQIKHAKRNNILMLRTIDIIRALDIVMENKKQLTLFKKYIFIKKGWMEVKSNNFLIH